MTDTIGSSPRHVAPKERSTLAKNLFSTLPIVLVGSMTVGFNLTGPIESAQAKPRVDKPKGSSTELATAVKKAFVAAATSTSDAEVSSGQLAVAAAPSTYTVKGGDSVSSIAGRYGLATASVLALNGLSWKSVIHPGQVLRLGAGATGVAPAPRRRT